jgi:hypothetical protein
MRNVCNKVVEKIKTHIFYAMNFFFFENRVVYVKMSEILVEPEATNNDTIWCIRVSSWIRKATCVHAHAHTHKPGNQHVRMHILGHTHTDKYVIFIVLSRQQ